jgi:hypothetical protein
MEYKMANLKAPIIAASVAVIAVLITIVVIYPGSSSGIYVSDVRGSVTISDDKGDTPVSAELILSQGDIITVGPDSSCTVTYKGKNNAEENYLIIGSNTQVIVNSKFTGSNAGELFLNRGSIIGNLLGESKGEVSIRTANAMVYVQKTVTKVMYYTKDDRTYTDIVDFMGNSKIQQYDVSGNPFNQIEPLLENYAASVVSGDEGPSFEYLNTEFSLSVLTAEDLKTLAVIAQSVQGFPYSAETLSAAFAAASTSAVPGDLTSSITSEPIVTAVPIDSDSFTDTTTTIPPAVTDAPPRTVITVPTVTARPQTTTATATTTAPATTTAATTTVDNSRMLTVVLSVDGEDTMYEVPYGGSLEKPDDPVVDGYTFAGWDRSFDNITEDVTITANFIPDDGGLIPEPDPSDPPGGNGDDTLMHNVTVVIADKSQTIQVRDGESAGLSATIDVPGYRFLGWDSEYTNITEDMTITAILEPLGNITHTVTFIIDGIQYPVEVADGQTAVPPFPPTSDKNGNAFINWDISTTNIKADTVITAIYTMSTTFTVTFDIDGFLYDTTVSYGQTAMPPFTPEPNRYGEEFIGWDKTLLNITSNQTITALYRTY